MSSHYKIAEVVTRDVFLLSHTIVLCDSEKSPMEEAFRKIAMTRSRQPRFVRLSDAAELGHGLQLHCKTDELLSVWMESSPMLVLQLLPCLNQFANSPIVVHVEVDGDLSDVLLLQSAAPYLLHSSDAQEAHHNALAASRLAFTAKKIVVHVFQANGASNLMHETSDDELRGFLLQPGVARPGIGSKDIESDDSMNVFANGHIHDGGGGYGHGSGVRLEIETLAVSTSDNTDGDEIYAAYRNASMAAAALTHRSEICCVVYGSSTPHTVVFVFGCSPAVELDGVKWVSISLLSPILPPAILRHLPSSVKTVLVLEQLSWWNQRWSPFYLDVAASVELLEQPRRPSVRSMRYALPSSITSLEVEKIILDEPLHCAVDTLEPQTCRVAGFHKSQLSSIPKHESSYTAVLSQLFTIRLQLLNSPDSCGTLDGSYMSSPEFALGLVRRQLDERAGLIRRLRDAVRSGDMDSRVHRALAKWFLVKENSSQSRQASEDVLHALDEIDASGPGKSLAGLTTGSIRSLLPSKSRWIIGSDAWSYDLGSSGLHHLISSGLDVNILIIDSTPYTKRKPERDRRKRDVGLYAMSRGDVYVASVAIFWSYGQTLQALMEADCFNGPSVVLAYLPNSSKQTTALEIMKETKLAVDAGYWALYRWDPSKEHANKDPISLDSEVIKQELRDFLDRQNHLSQLTRSGPQFTDNLASSQGESFLQARQQRAKQAYEELMSNISAAPLLVLYASDAGGAEKKAKRLASRGRARGLATSVAPMDSKSVEEVAEQQYVAFVTSVAGQGESPQNGRKFVKALSAAISEGVKPFNLVKYSVFGMGDSHYWPRPEDAHYYNRAGKELDVRLELLGGERFAELGLGDDHDEDGPETGYNVWESQLWKALGVNTVEVKEAEPECITFEHMKTASNYLRGTISEWLADSSAIPLPPSDVQVAKFHGVYQQDDRDIRYERQARGIEPAYSFMIRVRLPAGLCTPSQWLVLDRIADEYGNGTFKITTRQTFQFHGVIKKHLKATIQDINRSLLDTLVACGDAIRNILCSAMPSMSKLHSQVFEFSKTVSDHFLPHTSAYHEIWLDKKMIAGQAIQDFEPFYGQDYLPRKFKIAIAVPPTNDVEVFAHDVGLIAIVDVEGNLEGFNVLAGGGMGVTHGNRKTYPRLASLLGFCSTSQAHSVIVQIMTFHRDNGNRSDRKNGRLMYTIDRIGLDSFKAKIEKMLGWSFEAARPFTFDRNVDDFGWSQNEDGRHNFMMFIENGRVQDSSGVPFKTGLREIAKVHKGTFRLTANQHLMLADIPSEELTIIKTLLSKYQLDNLNHSGLRLSSSACVAFPTCGLAMAESERYLPILINKVESICEENGLRSDSIVMRMSGCPNGCSRPYLGEIAFVGKSLGTYVMLLGGGYHGQRLNKIYRESVTEPQILAILKPMIKHYALGRLDGEHFGDFVVRVGYISPTIDGTSWYEGIGGLGKHREISIG